MIDKSGLQPKKNTYGGVVLNNTNDNLGHNNTISALDVSEIPITQKQQRKQRKENEQLQKILRIEAENRKKLEAEISAARIAAIKASRQLGRQAATGVNIG